MKLRNPVMLSLIALEHGFEIKHKVPCPECGKPLKLYLHEEKYGNADCINLKCGTFGYNSIGGSIHQHMPKYSQVMYELFSKEYQKMFTVKQRSKYLDILPKRVLLKMWIDYQQYKLFRPLWKKYYNRKYNQITTRIHKLQEKQKTLSKSTEEEECI